MKSNHQDKIQSNPSRNIDNDFQHKGGISRPAVPVLQGKSIVQKSPEEKEDDPSVQLKGSAITGTDSVLEEEDDAIGSAALQMKSKEEEELPLQGKFIIQKQELSEEDELPIQGKFISKYTQTIQRKSGGSPIAPERPLQKKENNTGLPGNLKAGVENLSGLSMDDVKVHYNSDKPVQLNALAYAQGTDIHVGPGQEKHLPHEAWHVVQQKQGRVQPTTQLKGAAVNDDVQLEHEADVMGMKSIETGLSDQPDMEGTVQKMTATSYPAFVQRKKSGALAKKENDDIFAAILKTNPRTGAVRLARLKSDVLTALDDKQQTFLSILEVTTFLKLNGPNAEDEVETGKLKAEPTASPKIIKSSNKFDVSEPKAEMPVFTSIPEYITVTIDGQPYRLIAGQNYLNDEQSKIYLHEPGKIKGAPAKLYPANDLGSDVLQVGDGHHRLVFGLLHNQDVDVLLYTLPATPSTRKNWSALLYKSTPENMKILPLQETEMDDYKQKALTGFVSPDNFFTGMGGQSNIVTFIVNYLAYKKKTAEPNQIKELESFVASGIQTPFVFYDFVKWMGAKAKNKKVVETLLGTNDFPSGIPAVIMGKTKKGTGQIDQIANVIILDLVGNPDPDAMLDTLLFETQNARNIVELRDARSKDNAGYLTSVIEFDTTVKYCDALQRSYKASNINDLVKIFQIPMNHLVKDNPGSTSVSMPDETLVPGKDRRTALWFFKTQDWLYEQKRDMFLGTGHTKDSESTVSGYSNTKKVDIFK